MLKSTRNRIISFKKRKMKLLTNEQQELCEKAKVCYMRGERFENKYASNKKYCKVIDQCCYTGEYRCATVYII